MNMGGSMPGGDQNGMATPMLQTTTYVKDEMERKETVMHMGLMTTDTVTIQKCSTHLEYKLDPALKIYTEGPIGGLAVAPPTRQSMQKPSKDTAKSGGTGQVITTVNIQDLGTEVISKLKTHHAMITTRIQTSGCSGDSDTTMRIETWTAPIQTYSCPEQYAPTREVYMPDTGCKVSYIMHGDLEGVRSAYGGMIVQMKMYSGDKMIGEQTMTDYSQDKLDPALFQIPDDFKKVTDEEFSKAQSKAMMDSLKHGGLGGMFGGGNQQDNGGGQQQDNGNGNGNQDNGNGNQGNGNGDQGNGDQPKPKHHGFGGLHLPF